MSIAKIADFTVTSATPGKCFILGTAKPRNETFVYRIGEVDQRKRGTVEISAQACRELAQMVGWTSPQTREQLQEQVDMLAVELEAAEELLQERQALIDTIRTLTRELDLAQAVRDDAISQFHAQEKQAKKAPTSV